VPKLKAKTATIHFLKFSYLKQPGKIVYGAVGCSMQICRHNLQHCRRSFI